MLRSIGIIILRSMYTCQCNAAVASPLRNRSIDRYTLAPYHIKWPPLTISRSRFCQRPCLIYLHHYTFHQKASSRAASVCVFSLSLSLSLSLYSCICRHEMMRMSDGSSIRRLFQLQPPMAASGGMCMIRYE